MMHISKRLRTGVAAGAALLGSVALASAQQMPEKGREPAERQPSVRDPARDKAPEGKAERAEPGLERRPGTELPKTGAGPSDNDRPKAAERPEKERPKAVERSDREGKTDKERARAAERPDKARDNERAQGRDDTRAKGAELPDKARDEARDKDGARKAERPAEANKPGTAQSDRDKGARPRLSEQKRGEVGMRLRQTKIERTRVQVNVRIGAHLPRSVHVHRLPSAILVLAPDYRDYSYLEVEDGTILIVDPATYVVVDVIPASTRAASLSLTPEQMRFIYVTVPKDQSADVRMRLALGAEVPAHVVLQPFPAAVVAQIPEIEGYRYIVADGDVVIVDPRDRDIALVVSE